MPMNGFSIGRDVTLTIVTSSGPLNLSLITEFQSKPDTTTQKVKGLDGITRPLRFFDGWSGKFMVDRQDATVDSYFAQLESDYYAGVNEQPASLTETITEVDGSVSQFRYLNVLLTLDDAGGWKSDATVKQTLSFMAARRLQVS